MTDRIPAGAVWALGATQIIGYGTLYYSFTVLSPSIAATFGWPNEWIFAALSLALLGGGLLAPLAGHCADRFGAARTMVAGSAAVALTLVVAAMAPNGWLFAAALLLMELASTFVLYATAFAALVQMGGQGAQRRITHLTLIAGFASTLFWPLTVWLQGFFDWRTIYLLFAGMNLVVCLPLHWWLTRLARRPAHATATVIAATQTPVPEAPTLPEQGRAVVFALLLVGFAIEGFILAGILMHIVPILGTLGLGASAILVTTLFGPAQVASRLINMLFGRSLRQTHLGIIAALLLPLGVAVLALTAPSVPGALLFALLFGLGSGLTSIVSGSLPLELFGRERYGARLGWLSSARQIASAVAPFALALVMTTTGTAISLWIVALSGAGSIAAFTAVAILARRPTAVTQLASV
jgi:MFS family permease